MCTAVTRKKPRAHVRWIYRFKISACVMSFCCVPAQMEEIDGDGIRRQCGRFIQGCHVDAGHAYACVQYCCWFLMMHSLHACHTALSPISFSFVSLSPSDLSMFLSLFLFAFVLSSLGLLFSTVQPSRNMSMGLSVLRGKYLRTKCDV